LRAKRSNPSQSGSLDCFVACAPRNGVYAFIEGCFLTRASPVTPLPAFHAVDAVLAMACRHAFQSGNRIDEYFLTLTVKLGREDADACQIAVGTRQRADQSPVLYNNRLPIIRRTAELRLPAIYQFPEMTTEGALFAYGPRIGMLYGSMVALKLVKVLRGARPADLPIEQPTKFELAINLKTDALGVTIPPTLVARADQVIE
jgi:hypothetical protein